ncbi:MAG: hypothetical protein ACYTF1_07750 [Planctomycetota bacterium]|jgi:hypothetical protein
MEFHLNMTIEIDRMANGLAVRTPVQLQLLHREGQWQALCENPPFNTLFYDTLEETLVTAAKRAAAPTKPESLEQPHIIGKITPD